MKEIMRSSLLIVRLIKCAVYHRGIQLGGSQGLNFRLKVKRMLCPPVRSHSKDQSWPWPSGKLGGSLLLLLVSPARKSRRKKNKHKGSKTFSQGKISSTSGKFFCYFYFLLRYDSHIISSLSQRSVQVRGFSIFIKLYHHHCCLILEYFHHPRRKSLTR